MARAAGVRRRPRRRPCPRRRSSPTRQRGRRPSPLLTRQRRPRHGPPRSRARAVDLRGHCRHHRAGRCHGAGGQRTLRALARRRARRPFDDRRAAVPEPEWFGRPGLLQRRVYRRAHRPARRPQPRCTRRDRAHHCGPLPRRPPKRRRDRPRPERAVRARRQHPPRRRPRAHHRAAHRRDEPDPALGRKLRPRRPRRPAHPARCRHARRRLAHDVGAPGHPGAAHALARGLRRDLARPGAATGRHRGLACPRPRVLRAGGGARFHLRAGARRPGRCLRRAGRARLGVRSAPRPRAEGAGIGPPGHRSRPASCPTATRCGGCAGCGKAT